MNQALICNKWKINLLNGIGGHYKWLNKNAKVVGHNALCQEWLLANEGLEESRILEPFGGLGIASVVIRNLLKPSWQRVHEIDDDCLKQLKECIEPLGVETGFGDAKKTVVDTEADIYIMDFASYTCHHFKNWEKQWDAIFNRKPKAVSWFDSSAKYLHLNKDLYSKELGSPINNKDDYAKAVSKFIYDRYGYSITKAAYEPTAYMVYFLGKPVPPGKIDVFVPQKTDVGFKFLP